MGKKATELSGKGMRGRARMDRLRESLQGEHAQTFNNLMRELGSGREINANQRLFVSKFIDVMNYATAKLASVDQRGQTVTPQITIVDYSKAK